MEPIKRQYGWMDAFKDLCLDAAYAVEDKFQSIKNDFLRSFTLGFVLGLPLFLTIQTIEIIIYAIATDFVW